MIDKKYSYKDLVEICGQAASLIPPMMAGNVEMSGMSALLELKLDAPELDDEIAQAFDDYWHNGEWPDKALSPYMMLQLYWRLKMAEYILSEAIEVGMKESYTSMQSLVLIVSNITDAWHIVRRDWLLSLNAPDMLMPKSSGKIVPIEDRVYCQKWIRKYGGKRID